MLIEQQAIKTVSRFLVLSLAATVLTTSCGRKGPEAPPDTTPPSIIATQPGLVNNNAVAPDTSLTATFSEPVDETTITFMLGGGNDIIPCTMSYNGSTAIFTPARVLDFDTLYTAMVSAGVKDLAGNPMPDNYLWIFMTGAASKDTTPPSVSVTTPTNGAAKVIPNAALSATFSEAVDQQTISFVLSTGTTTVPCAMTYSGTTAIFSPAGDLAYSTQYTATVSAGVKDLAGNPMLSDYTWTFNTGSASDTTPPYIAANTPAVGAVNVGINLSPSVTFSEAVDQSTITFTLSAGSVTIPCTMSYNGTTAIFTPASPLSYSTLYTATVSAGVKDLAGNLMTNDYLWFFITGAANKDTTPPSVSATIPTNGATKVVPNAALSATFREAVDQSTITFMLLSAGGVAVPTTMSYAGTTAIFTPAGDLSYNTKYTATVIAGVKDLAGNLMTSGYTWTFTTGSAPDTTPPFVTANTPAAGATNVSMNILPSVTFSEAVDQSTITFTLSAGSVTIPCTMSYSGK